MKQFAVCLLTILTLSGCTASPAVDAGQAAGLLVQELPFTDTLVEADGEAAQAFYDLDKSVRAYAIHISGSGATPEEVAVLQARKADDVARVQEIVRGRLDLLERQFSLYRPEEMPKLRDAVIEVRGDTVYLVCTDDPGRARELIASLYEADA